MTKVMLKAFTLVKINKVNSDKACFLEIIQQLFSLTVLVVLLLFAGLVIFWKLLALEAVEE